jgi:NIMA (never in mitosis gene a)-related kinase
MTEIAVLASIPAHPNVISFKESWVTDQTLSMVMELADAGDLKQAIKRQRKSGKYFSEVQVMSLFAQLALAIKHIHSRNILHRDLKTANIFLMKDGLLKLGDFGLSFVLSSEEGAREMTRLGTPYYISPEMCMGNNYSASNDIWAMGVVLYNMCTLQQPFVGESLNDLLQNIVETKPKKIPIGFSKQTSKLVKQLLTKDPLKRPSIDDVLMDPHVMRFTAAYKKVRAEDLERPISLVRPESDAALPLLQRMFEKLRPEGEAEVEGAENQPIGQDDLKTDKDRKRMLSRSEIFLKGLAELRGRYLSEHPRPSLAAAGRVLPVLVEA